MPGVSRVTVDTAVGTIVGNLAPKVIVEGVPIVVVGAAVEPHAPCPIPPHCDAVMAFAAVRAVSSTNVR